MGQRGLFDVETRYAKLDAKGDPLGNRPLEAAFFRCG